MYSCIMYVCLLVFDVYSLYRQSKEKLWDKAVMWIATNESRVRVETRMISGEQYDVWNWIQPEPPPTEVDICTSLHLVCI